MLCYAMLCGCDVDSLDGDGEQQDGDSGLERDAFMCPQSEAGKADDPTPACLCPTSLRLTQISPVDPYSIIDAAQRAGVLPESFGIGATRFWHQVLPESEDEYARHVIEEAIPPSSSLSEELWANRLGTPGGVFCPFECRSGMASAPFYSPDFTVGQSGRSEPWLEPAAAVTAEAQAGHIADIGMESHRQDSAFLAIEEFPNSAVPAIQDTHEGSVCGWACSQLWRSQSCNDPEGSLGSDAFYFILKHHPEEPNRAAPLAPLPPWSEIQVEKDPLDG